MNLKIDSFRAEMLSHRDELYGRLARLESEYEAIRAGVERIERSLADEQGRRAALRVEIESLKSRVTELELRLERLDSEANDSHDA